MVALTGLFPRVRQGAHCRASALTGPGRGGPCGGRSAMWRSCVRLVVVAVLAVLAARPALAQVGGRPIEFSAQGGWFAPDARARMNSTPTYGATLGIRAVPWLVFEGQASFASSKVDSVPEPTMDFVAYGLDMRFNMRSAEDRVVPYVLVGLASATSSSTGTPPDDLNRGAPSPGLGALINLGNQRAFLRVQARDLFFRDRNAKEFSNDMIATVGLHWLLGGRPKDTDLDGVREWLDQCPNTPIGAKVDAKGCPKDS